MSIFDQLVGDLFQTNFCFALLVLVFVIVNVVSVESHAQFLLEYLAC